MSEYGNRFRRHHAGLAGAVLAGVLLVTGAVLSVRGKDATPQRDIHKLTFALAGPVRSLDHYHSYDVASATALANGLEGLLRYADDGRLTPALASSWSQPDPLTYVYRLRRGVTFWDGRPLTTSDVVFSMSQNMQPKVASEMSSLYTSVRWIRATGPNVVTVKLKTPDPFFRYVPATQAGYIIEKRFALQAGSRLGTPGVLTMGTGPYRFTKYVPDEGVSLTRYDKYWGQKGAVKNVDLKVITDPATRLLAMRSGEVDGTFDVPPDQADQWQRIDGARVVFTPQLRVAFFSFDTEAAPWSDIHVRKAFAYAIDRRGLVRTVLRGHGEVANALPPPQQWGGGLAQSSARKFYSSLPSYSFNMDRANQELAASSVPNGFTATVVYPDSRKPLGDAALNLSQNLKQLGVTLNVREVTTAQWVNGIHAHKHLGIQVASFVVDYPDPANLPSLMFDSKYAAPNGFNVANYKNQAVDRLLARQAASNKRAVRAAALRQILAIAARDLPYVPVWWQDVGLAIKRAYAYRGFSTWYYFQPWLTRIKNA